MFGVGRPRIENDEEEKQIIGVFFQILQRGNVEEVRQKIEELDYRINLDGGRALSVSVEAKQWEVMKLLIKLGAEVESNDNNALHCAAREKNKAICLYLLQKGATAMKWPDVDIDFVTSIVMQYHRI